ncbi:MAG: hypothetical protein AAF740_01775 [Bacteroidota bacterium]
MTKRIFAVILTLICMIALSTNLWAQIPVIGRIAINDGASTISTTDGKVTLKIFARNAAEMRISNNGSWIGARWEPYTQIKRWRLDIREDGLKKVYAQFRNSDRSILSDPVVAEVILDRSGPTDASVNINFGQEFTTDRKVTVEVFANDVKQMQISNRADFMRARWYPYRETINNWIIGGLDGKHKVYARFRDDAGNVSEVVSDTITLDRKPPTSSRLSINNDSVFTRYQQVHLRVVSPDATQMQIVNFADDEDHTADGGTGWIPYEEDHVHELLPGNGTKRVAVRFMDQSNNVSKWVVDKIVFDDIPPSATRVRINKGNRYTNRNEVNLQFAAVKASKMMASNDPDFKDAEWLPYRPYFSTWLIDRKEQGKKTVYAKFMDKAENVSEPTSDDIIYDNIEPKNPTIEIITKKGLKTSSGFKITNEKEGFVDLKLNAEDARYMMLSNTSTFFDARWDIYRPEYKDWKLDQGDGYERAVYVKFRDKAGNVTKLKYDKVIYDLEPPVDGRVAIHHFDAQYVRSDTTKLLLFARGASFFKASNRDTTGFAEAEWEPYTQVREGWILDPREGPQVVHVKYKDFAGNVSQVYTGSIYMDKTPPQEISLEINRGDTITNEPNKVVYIQARAVGAADMRISAHPGFKGIPWRFYSSKLEAFPLPGDDGLKKLHVQFRDSAGNVSVVAYDEIMLDRRPPIIGKVSIMDGVKNTRYQEVTIELEAKDAVEMRISNDPYLKEAKWEPYKTSKKWTLLGEDGLKTVYVQFRDKIGNISRIAYDRIGKDTHPPSNPELTINQKGTKYVTNINKYVRLYLRVREANVMRVANSQAGLDSADWQPYKYILEDWILEGNDGNKEVWAQFMDDAGNRAITSQKVILDRQAPYDEEVTINNAEPLVNKRQVTLQIKAKEAVQMRVSDRRSFPAPSKWIPYQETMNWTLIGREGLKAVHVQFRDEAGNVSYTTSAQIDFDMTPPGAGFIKIGNGKSLISRTEVPLTFSAKDADFMMVSNDPNFAGATWQDYKKFIPSWPLASGTGYRRVYAKFKDKHQNESPVIFAEVTVE